MDISLGVENAEKRTFSTREIMIETNKETADELISSYKYYDI